MGGSSESVSTGGAVPAAGGIYQRGSAAGNAATENFAGSCNQMRRAAQSACRARLLQGHYSSCGGCAGHSWRRNAGYCDSVARGAAHMLYSYAGFAPDGTALLSRRSAQEAALEQIFRENTPGDILPAVVTGLAPFGASLRHRLRRIRTAWTAESLCIPAYTSGRSAAGRAAAACFDPVTRSGEEARGTDAAGTASGT